ncbi:MAG: glycosyltransferase [Pseudomonadota bacterium]
MPFDRLVRAVDAWAQRNSEVQVFAQIGNTDFVPLAMQWVKVLSPDDYQRTIDACDLLIGHAGMGTIITAAESGKPLLVMPRRGNLRETRNNHQVATAGWLSNRTGVRVAMDEHELVAELDRVRYSTLPPVRAGAAAGELIDTLRRFIE